MKKFIMLSALFFVFFSVATPDQAISSKNNVVIKKLKILQGTAIHPMYGWEISLSFNTNTNQVIGVASPDVTITGFTFSAASATTSTITVSDLELTISGSSGPIDASGDYTIF